MNGSGRNYASLTRFGQGTKKSEAWRLDAEYDILCFNTGHRRRGKSDRILKKQCYWQRDIQGYA